MTISKKMLLIATAAIGLQLNINAYYISLDLKTEMVSIFNFMDTLATEKAESAQTLIKQLEKEFKNAETKYGWNKYKLENIDIINIARIIEKNQSLDEKIKAVSDILTIHKNAKLVAIKKAKKELTMYIGAHIGLIGIMILPLFFMSPPTQTPPSA